jgi:hypothetical protein
METKDALPAAAAPTQITLAEAPEFTSERPSITALMLSDKNMEQMIRFADIMATGKVTVPDALRNPGDCMAITMQSLQWGMNPFAVAQKTHMIQGKLGYEAQLVNAVITTMAPTKDRLHYEWFGPWDKILGKFVEKTSQKGNTYRAPGWSLADEAGIGIRIWATLKGESEPRELTLLLSQAATRNSTLWAEDPRQQLAYLATKRWSRLYCPDVILGVYTPDELEYGGEKEINPPPPMNRRDGAAAGAAARTTATTIDPEQEAARKALIDRLEGVAKNAGVEPYAEEWKKLSKDQRKLVGSVEHERLKAVAATPRDEERDDAASSPNREAGHDA